MRDELQVIGIALGCLVVVGTPVWLLIRAGNRLLARQRAQLEAQPLAQFRIDAALMRQFYHWQAREAEGSRKAMGPRMLKIALWLSAILMTAGIALGAWRSDWQTGALLGLAFSAICLLPALLVVILVAIGSRIRERQLRRMDGAPALAFVGAAGVSMRPGAFSPVLGEIHRVDLLAGPPLVLQIISRTPNPRGGNSWHYARTPVPAVDREAAEHAVAGLRSTQNAAQ